MTKPPQLDDLIARLEEAARPDRGLDAEIALSIGWTFHRDPFFEFWREPDGTDADDEHEEPPQFTASLDAAMTLVPEGMMWFLGHLDPSDMRFCATMSERGNVGVSTWRGFSSTATLALCIAALKAKSR